MVRLQMLCLFPHCLRSTTLFVEIVGLIMPCVLSVLPPPPISLFPTTNLLALCGWFSLLLGVVGFFTVVLWLYPAS